MGPFTGYEAPKPGMDPFENMDERSRKMMEEEFGGVQDEADSAQVGSGRLLLEQYEKEEAEKLAAEKKDKEQIIPKSKVSILSGDDMSVIKPMTREEESKVREAAEEEAKRWARRKIDGNKD